MTQLLNDAFDSMNGRRYVERIHRDNWEEKKKPLTDLLEAIEETERHSKMSNKNEKPFLSETSLKAAKITLTSTIELVEFLLSRSTYDYVFTGKFNQDCIGVIIEAFIVFSVYDPVPEHAFYCSASLASYVPAEADWKRQQHPPFSAFTACCHSIVQ